MIVKDVKLGSAMIHVHSSGLVATNPIARNLAHLTED